MHVSWFVSPSSRKALKHVLHLFWFGVGWNPLAETQWKCQRWSPPALPSVDAPGGFIPAGLWFRISYKKLFFPPPALPTSLSASSRKCLALCRVGWLCTSNLPVPSYVLSKRWMRRREGEQNYTCVYTYAFVELASGEDEGLGRSETSWMPPGFFSHCVISFQLCLGPLSSPGCVHR